MRTHFHLIQQRKTFLILGRVVAIYLLHFVRQMLQHLLYLCLKLFVFIFVFRYAPLQSSYAHQDGVLLLRPVLLFIYHIVDHILVLAEVHFEVIGVKFKTSLLY